MTKKYRHIYFDLDRTLWDFESNAEETFQEIFEKYELDRIFPDFDTFHESYKKHNQRLWKAYRDGKLKKQILRNKRFELTLEEYGNTDTVLAEKIGDDYITISPTKTRLFPGAKETLEYLNQKYNLYIITNGFNEVQFTKIQNCGIRDFFSAVFTSEDAGAQKPHKKIFQHALKNVNAKKSESIMIGDDLESDIQGALNFGMDQIFFNPQGKSHDTKPSFEIRQLPEIKSIL